MGRKKKLMMNTVSALVLQLVTLICGFILPKQILTYFGSDVNGLVSSITRFLSVITFAELGIGPVIQSNLYKPLAEKDEDTISKVVVSAEQFYRRIAYVFIAYIAVLFFVYPAANTEFDFWFTASLILIISISTFVRYYFGITYQVFLNADQKVYVHSLLRTLTVILNTLLSVFMMKMGASVHIVKLVSASVYVVQPFALNFYVQKKYKINKKITYTKEPIQQKWNGFAQHMASVICGEIAIVLLTFFASYQSVSIYSVYFLVVSGITNLVTTTVSGLESFWGNIIAKKEDKLLQQTFEIVELVIHTGVTFLFCTAAIMIAPFVNVYVSGLSDAGAYNFPLFGCLLAFAYASQCLRIPYFRVIKAAGHYKETQNGAFISVGLNIILSLILVIKLGLLGVAVGTLAAMLYHTIYFAWYLRKNILHRSFRHFIMHMVTDLLCGVGAFTVAHFLNLSAKTYQEWLLKAFPVALIILAICMVIKGIVYRKTGRIALALIVKKSKK